MYQNSKVMENIFKSKWQFIPYFSVRSGILVQLLSATVNFRKLGIVPVSPLKNPSKNKELEPAELPWYRRILLYIWPLYNEVPLYHWKIWLRHLVFVLSEEYLLENIDHYNYLSNGKVLVGGVDDPKEFNDTVEALKIMNVSDEDINCKYLFLCLIWPCLLPFGLLSLGPVPILSGASCLKCLLPLSWN